MNQNKTVILVQARLGSTRLPGKMQKRFANDKSLLEVVIEQLKKTGLQIIIATSTNEENDWIAQKAAEYGCLVFRGEENDVLQRFIDAANEYQAENLIRVCADNPFILPNYLKDVANSLENGNEDYIAFAFKDGLPTIKSHIGLFGEGCTLDGLKRIKQKTSEAFYCEHVTNYFYDNPDGFSIRFLPLPEQLESRKDVRLTIDTEADFNLSSQLYHKLYVNGQLDDIDVLLNEIDGHPMYLKTMKNEITRNSK